MKIQIDYTYYPQLGFMIYWYAKNDWGLAICIWGWQVLLNNFLSEREGEKLDD